MQLRRAGGAVRDGPVDPVQVAGQHVTAAAPAYLSGHVLPTRAQTAGTELPHGGQPVRGAAPRIGGDAEPCTVRVVETAQGGGAGARSCGIHRLALAPLVKGT